MCSQIVEIIGYAGRAASYSMTGELAPYITQSIFLLLAPVLFAASLYMTLGRLIRRVQGDSCSIIPPGWLTKIFVFGDVFSFLVQGSGAGLMASGSASSMKNGENIVVAGLVLQILMFGLFVLTGAIFNVRFRKLAPTARQTDIPWQSTLYMLYVTSAFIMLRNIFRVVEYASGQDKYPLQNEWLVYVFDGVLMLFTMMWFFFRYPSHTKPILHGRNQSEERSGKA